MKSRRRNLNCTEVALLLATSLLLGCGSADDPDGDRLASGSQGGIPGSIYTTSSDEPFILDDLAINSSGVYAISKRNAGGLGDGNLIFDVIKISEGRSTVVHSGGPSDIPAGLVATENALYWGSYTHECPNLWMANPDGSDPVVVASLCASSGDVGVVPPLAADTDGVYWYQDQMLKFLPRSGGAPQVLSQLGPDDATPDTKVVKLAITELSVFMQMIDVAGTGKLIQVSKGTGDHRERSFESQSGVVSDVIPGAMAANSGQLALYVRDRTSGQISWVVLNSDADVLYASQVPAGTDTGMIAIDDFFTMFMPNSRGGVAAVSFLAPDLIQAVPGLPGEANQQYSNLVFAQGKLFGIIETLQLGGGQTFDIFAVKPYPEGEDPYTDYE